MAVIEGVHFPIGADVACDDEVCGDLLAVVVDPVARTVTHLVVEPKHRRGLGRLVPVALVELAADGVRLRGGARQFDELDRAEETQFLPGYGGGTSLGYRSDQAYGWPYYGLGGSGSGMEPGTPTSTQTVVVDRVPLGDIEVRRDQGVHATDGWIGQVQGLVIDPADHQVTHVLLQEGHLWGRKQVAIPIKAVVAVTDGIELNLTKEQVQDLPPVEVDHPDRA